MSNSFDPDQDRRSVGPDLGSNCLQRLPLARKELIDGEIRKMLPKTFFHRLNKFFPSSIGSCTAYAENNYIFLFPFTNFCWC